jgi:hypothetical protein
LAAELGELGLLIEVMDVFTGDLPGVAALSQAVVIKLAEMSQQSGERGSLPLRGAKLKLKGTQHRLEMR